MPKAKEPEQYINELYGMYKDLARENLIDFTEYTHPCYEVRWFHRLIADKLDKLLEGRIQNLMVCMPGQFGKSTLVSQALPAYALGRYPDLRIALCTYAASLAEGMNRIVQRTMDSTEYAELFPGTKIGGDGYIRTSKMFEIQNREGSFRSVGIGGSLSGFRVDLGSIDDPVKNMADACSEKIRNSTWEWYNSVYRIRAHNGTKTLLTMTRWHEDDLAGRILASEGDEWEVISLPYIMDRQVSTVPEDTRKEGEALWPERHSVKKAESIKKNSERIFQAMCQQVPSPAEGTMFKQQWFRYYTVMPGRFDRIIQSWDCAFKDTKDSDYVVGTVWGMIGNMVYLIAMTRGKMDFATTVRSIKEMREAFPYSTEILIEDKANGTAIISVLKKEIQGIIAISPTESKESRAYAISFEFEAGNVYFPANCLWVKEVENELKTFPHGKYDDIVDSISQALRWLLIRKYGRLLHMGQ